MKKILLSLLVPLILSDIFVAAQAQTNFNTLSYFTSFGTNGDGSIHPGDAPYLTATGKGGANFQRAMAFNPLTGNLLLIDRQTNASFSTADIGRIVVLNGTTGAQVDSLDTNGISGGDLFTDAIGVADDGVVYICNLVNGDNTLLLTIYRWNSESLTNLDGTTNFASVAYTGNPANDGVIHESWGINMAVRGAGTNTQIICGTRSFVSKGVVGTNAAVFTTVDGTNFTATPLTTDVGVDDAFGRAGGIAFGAGNTFWAIQGSATSNPQLIRHLSFDLVNSNATVLQSFDTAAMVPPFAALNATVGAGPAGLTVDPANNLLAIFEMVAGAATGTNHVRLYDIEDLANPPVLLDVKDMRVSIDISIIGYLAFGSGRLYAHDVNAGIVAFTVEPSVGSYPKPGILSQPSPALQKVVAGASTSYQVLAVRTLGYQWQLNEVDIPGATTYKLDLSNLSESDQGNYTVVLTNSAGATTSSVARLEILFTDDFARLSNLWGQAVGTQPYLTTALDANTPFNRSIAFYAPSNHLYLIDRTGPAVGLTVNVLDGTSGTFLYTLKTNGISAGNIILLSIAVSDDGSIYAANMTAPGAAVAPTYKLYRWTNSHPDTVPVLVYGPADPLGTNGIRWGDSMDVRGAGTNTEIIIDAGTNNNTGAYAALLAPTDESLNTFVSVDKGNGRGFIRRYNNGTPASSLGRSLQFGPTNTIWQKRRGQRLELSSYDLTNRTSTLLTNISVLPTGIGPVAVDSSRKLLAGINFVAGANQYDTLDLYDISDFTSPALLGRYDFPVTHPNSYNANFVGQVLITEDRVFATDGNNSIMALAIIPPLTPALTIVRTGANVTISWTNSVSGWELQCNTNLTSTNWVYVSNAVIIVDNQNTVTNTIAGGSKFYRLLK